MAEVSKSAVPDAQLFRDAFHASPIGIVVENLDGRPLLANPAFCRFLGFREEELRHKHCVDFSPTEDAEKDWALFQQLKAGSIDHYQIEKRYYRRDGSLVWGSLSISLLNIGDSPLVLAMVEDITEKKKAEEARFRHAVILESSDDAIASGTLDGSIVSWNAGAEKMYGYTEAEAVGKPISILVPPELPGEENKILETLQAGGRIEHFETTRVTKTGKRINVSLTIAPIKDASGKTVGISGIARDITERKHAEEALRESEQRFRLAVQAGKMYSFDWDVRSDVVVRSPEHGKILHPRERLPFTHQQFVNRIHPDDRPKFLSTIAGLTPEEPTAEIVYRVPRSDGAILWLRSSGRAFFDGAGKLRRVVGMVADITDLKAAEEALSGMSRKLIESQEQERARVARELHDDINQRLALLSVEVEACRQNPPDSAADVSILLTELQQRINEISSEVQSISHRLHSSQLEYLGIVAAARNFCLEFSESQNLEIDFHHDGVPRSVSSDVSLCLFRILQEALHNAVKYSKARHCEVRLSCSENQLSLTVSDHGVGFDPESALRKGGLGLTSMRERVRLINGTILIESKPMRGTTIRVRVPVESEHGSGELAV